MNRNARENVEYNSFAKTFSNSRKNMKWEEISYFLSIICPLIPSFNTKGIGVLDVGCGSGRLLGELKKIGINNDNYLGLDLSSGLLEEAIENHLGFNFKELNMLDLEDIENKFNFIFYIASFHHLKFIEDRLKVLKDTYNLLESGGMVFMTNWALDSNLNKQKYNNSIIKGSENEFGSSDYNIKIGKFNRFYHCFCLEELEYLSKKSGFKIIENRLFENKKNYILILKKS